MLESETIDVQKCPKCGKRHLFFLSIDRSLTIGYQTMIGIEKEHSKRKVRITRLFNCPEKHSKFQVSFSVVVPDSVETNSIQVGGIIETDGNE